ncbi:hypothetical protein V3Q77_03015 [Flavobacterium davisii]|uniref:Uncharacterized protein n=1 Tax=Flavobacterium davisii TaxID=2906077 RepID=A0ABW8PLM7_9FLAO
MNLLNNIIFSNSNIDINIGTIEFGWMDISLSTKDKKVQYCVSYISDPINDIIIKFAKCITNQPIDITPFKSATNLFHVIHDCEGQFFSWLFLKYENKLKILVWENEYQFDDWILGDFDTNKLLLFPEHDEIPNVNENLIFAINTTVSDFAFSLINSINQMKKQLEYITNQDSWGYNYDKKAYQIILNHLYSI